MSDRYRVPGMGEANKSPSEEAFFRCVESLGNYPQRELTHEFVYNSMRFAFITGQRLGREQATEEILNWNKKGP